MPDYQQSKIYKLCSTMTDDIYVGSTTQTLKDRFSGHRASMKVFNTGGHHYCTAFELVKHPDCYIELIELYPCETHNMLLMREGYYIKKSQCVNKIVSGRTKQETSRIWRDSNREKCKRYYTDNRANVLETSKVRYIANADEKKGKVAIYREENTISLNATHQCVCGGKYSKKHKSTHLKTQKHINFEVI